MTVYEFTAIVFSVSYKKKLLIILIPVILFLFGLLIFFVLKFFIPQIRKSQGQDGKISQVASPSPGVLGVQPQPSPSSTPLPSTPTPIPTSTPIQTPTPASTNLPSSAQLQAVTIEDCESVKSDLTLTVQKVAATSELSITYFQPSGSMTSGGQLEIPKGWDIPEGKSVADGEVLGTGCFKHTINGQVGNSLVTVVNSQDTQGNRARWNLVFGSFSSPDVILDTFINGNPGQGYTWKIERKFLFDPQPPIVFHLLISPAYVHETGKGSFLFKAFSKFMDGTSRTLEKLLDII